MFDAKWVREHPDLFDEGWRKRGLEPLAGEIVALDEKRRHLVSRLQLNQERRNAASKEIGQAKAQKDEARAQALMAEVAALKVSVPADEAALKEAEAGLHAIVSSIPNLPLPEVPVGADEHSNVERHRHGLP